MRGLALLVFVAACASGGVPNNGGGGGADAPNVPAPVCGDMKCAPSEVGQCTQDCGMPPPKAVCGNTTCEPPVENNTNCPGDCPVSQDCDHDTMCEPPESNANCADDCPAAADVCPPNPLVPGAMLPSACRGCAEGNAGDCIALSVVWPGADQAKCQACVVEFCVGKMANGVCEPFPGLETPFSCVDCFQ